MSDLVGNPEDWFSRVAAHLSCENVSVICMTATQRQYDPHDFNNCKMHYEIYSNILYPLVLILSILCFQIFVINSEQMMKFCRHSFSSELIFSMGVFKHYFVRQLHRKLEPASVAQ